MCLVTVGLSLLLQDKGTLAGHQHTEDNCWRRDAFQSTVTEFSCLCSAPTRSQVLPMVLIQRLHFENHWRGPLTVQNLQVVKKYFTSWYLMESRSWEVLGGERAPGSESFQKEMRGGPWAASLTPPWDFHEQILCSWSPPWKAHPASRDGKVMGPGQWGMTVTQLSAALVCFKWVCFLPLAFPHLLSPFFSSCFFPFQPKS